MYSVLTRPWKSPKRDTWTTSVASYRSGTGTLKSDQIIPRPLGVLFHEIVYDGCASQELPQLGPQVVCWAHLFHPNHHMPSVAANCLLPEVVTTTDDMPPSWFIVKPWGAAAEVGESFRREGRVKYDEAVAKTKGRNDLFPRSPGIFVDDTTFIGVTVSLRSCGLLYVVFQKVPRVFAIICWNPRTFQL